MYHDEPTLPFPAAAFAERVAALRQMMGERGLDLLLLVNPANLYYLTGFGTGSGASVSFLVLPLEGEMVWAMRRTEISNLRLGPADLRPRDAVGVDDSQDVAVVLAELVLERDFPRRRVGVEGEALAFTVSHQMKLGAALPDSDFIDASGLVEGLRAVKSPAELAYMRQAGAITAFAMAAGLDALRDGVTDAEFAAAVLAAALREGSGRMAALPYVVSGPGSARAHSSWCGSGSFEATSLMLSSRAASPAITFRRSASCRSASPPIARSATSIAPPRRGSRPDSAQFGPASRPTKPTGLCESRSSAP